MLTSPIMIMDFFNSSIRLNLFSPVNLRTDLYSVYGIRSVVVVALREQGRERQTHRFVVPCHCLTAVCALLGN